MPVPPPRVTEFSCDAYAHCTDPLCDGSGQQPVKAIRTLLEWTIGSRGGDGIFAGIVETSTEDLRFADADDSPCPSCGRAREVAVGEKPTYQRLSGFPQDGLLRMQGFDPGVQNSVADQRAAEEAAAQALRVTELEDKVSQLLEALGEKTAA